MSYGHLPFSLRSNIARLAVHRQGPEPHAFMKTESIPQAMEPGRPYRVLWDELEPVDLANIEALPRPVEPPHASLEAKWIHNSDANEREHSGNVFGDCGELVIETNFKNIRVPIAPTKPSMLAFYNVRLVTVGDCVQLEAPDPLAVTVKEYGSSYLEKYVLSEEYGGGPYLEVHDSSHLHMALDKQAHGYYLLAKVDPATGEYKVSAFAIPYGYAIITEPYVIHSGAFFVGRYRIVYSLPNRFSTVLLRNRKHQMLKLNIG